MKYWIIVIITCFLVNAIAKADELGVEIQRGDIDLAIQTAKQEQKDAAKAMSLYKYSQDDIETLLADSN